MPSRTPGLEQLQAARRILCVQPHYDDNDIGAGGALAALAASGAELIYLTVTDDLAGVLDPDLPDDQARQILKTEQRAAGAIIGVRQFFWLDYPDAGDFSYFELRRQLVGFIRRLRPDFVFTCDPWLPYEAHQDHIRTGRAVAEAAILYNLPRYRSDPEADAAYQPYDLAGFAFYLTQAANVLFDISAYRQQKHRALDCYQAQFRPEDLFELHQNLADLERQVGDQAGFPFGEQFKLLAPGQLHIDPQAWKA